MDQQRAVPDGLARQDARLDVDDAQAAAVADEHHGDVGGLERRPVVAGQHRLAPRAGRAAQQDRPVRVVGHRTAQGGVAAGVLHGHVTDLDRRLAAEAIDGVGAAGVEPGGEHDTDGRDDHGAEDARQPRPRGLPASGLLGRGGGCRTLVPAPLGHATSLCERLTETDS
ncbi:hypothetical protein ACFQ0B_55640 [Nonomuraea thailandensis]